MMSAFGVEHEVSKRNYLRAAERWDKREKRANRVENTAGVVGGTAGGMLGGAALRDAYFKDYPISERRMQARTMDIKNPHAAKIAEGAMHAKPGLKTLATAIGGTAIAAAATRAKHTAHRKAEKARNRQLVMLSKAEPGERMHHADLVKAFSVNRAGEASKVITRATRKVKAIRVNSAGEALPIRLMQPGKGPQRKPFLHPQARPFKAHLASERYAAGPVPERAEFSNVESVKIARALGGPKAPKKTLKALSGADYEETIGRLGRATRRQKKEFSAKVHPLSGRVMDMRRGEAGAVLHSSGHRFETKSSLKLAQLADRAKNPAVKERAFKTLNRENQMTRGPEPVSVHNHPQVGGKPGHERHYPSTPDLQGAVHGNQGTHVVLSHKPGPRGSKQTMAVTTRAVKPNSAKTLPSVAVHDAASITPELASHVAGGNKAVLNDLAERRGAVRAGKKRKFTSYDKYIKRKTGTVKAAQKSGFYTKETMHKALEPGQLMHNADLAKGLVPATEPGVKKHKKIQGALGTAAAVTGLTAAASKGGAKLLPKLMPKIGAAGGRGGAYQKHLDRTADALLYAGAGLGGISGIHQAQIMGAEGKLRKQPVAKARMINAGSYQRPKPPKAKMSGGKKAVLISATGAALAGSAGYIHHNRFGKPYKPQKIYNAAAPKTRTANTPIGGKDFAFGERSRLLPNANEQDERIKEIDQLTGKRKPKESE